MINAPKLVDLEEWLIREALGAPRIPDIFPAMCARMCEVGLTVDRAMLAWMTLHPLFEAESVLWRSEGFVEHAQHRHDDQETEDWLLSPMKAVRDSGDPVLRRRLSGPEAELDFPLCTDLATQGFTDYLIISTNFHVPALPDFSGRTGIMVSWATREPGGFTDEAVEAIEYLQTRLALTCQASIQGVIAATIAETYLGPRAGARVLSGQIRHGDGERIKAVVFYCDLRGSSALADRLGAEAYLKLLNTYFAATAGAVAAEGGEILDFIGDAVLAVFPTDIEGFVPAARRAIGAVAAVRSRLAEVPDEIRCGIALSAGSVMFGNIGIEDRLTFSVIGRTVNAAARIEALTKSLGCPVLVTKEIAAVEPELFMDAGLYALAGFTEPVELFCLSEDAGYLAASEEEEEAG